MSTQRNGARTRGKLGGGLARTTHDGASVDESVLRALEADSRLLVAFPWARHLSSEQRARFAEELAHHPTDMTNAAIEDLLVTWRARADEARAGRAQGDVGKTRRTGKARRAA
jgi:hypothetical protein